MDDNFPVFHSNERRKKGKLRKASHYDFHDFHDFHGNKR